MNKYLLLILPVILVLGGCSIGEYEGKTAEEWANSYYQENTDKVNLQNELDDLQYEYNDLESERDYLQNEYDDLQGCVEDYPHNAAYNCV